MEKSREEGEEKEEEREGGRRERSIGEKEE